MFKVIQLKLVNLRILNLNNLYILHFIPNNFTFILD